MDGLQGHGPAAAKLLDLPPLVLDQVWAQLDHRAKHALQAASRSSRDFVRASTTRLEVWGSVAELLALDVSVAAPNLRTFRLRPRRAAMSSWSSGNGAVTNVARLLSALPDLRDLDLAPECGAFTPTWQRQQDARFGADFLRALQPMTQLRRLRLGKVDPRHVPPLLAALSHLTCLRLAVLNSGSGSPSPLAGLALERIQDLELVLSAGRATFHAAPSMVLASLTRLVLPCHDLKADSWPELVAAAPALQHLQVHRLYLPPAGCAPLLHLAELTTSTWPEVALDPGAPQAPRQEHWARLGAALPALEVVHIISASPPACPTVYAKALTSAVLPRLRLVDGGSSPESPGQEFSLSGFPLGQGPLLSGTVEATICMDAGAVAALASFAAVTHLVVKLNSDEKPKLPISCLTALRALPLQSLELGHIGAPSDTPGDFTVLASWPRLRRLKWDMSHRALDVLTDAKLAPVLASLPQLEALSLMGSSSQLGSPERSMTLGLVRAALQHCPLLQQLAVDACGIWPSSEQSRTDEARAIATSLGRHNLKLYVRT